MDGDAGDDMISITIDAGRVVTFGSAEKLRDPRHPGHDRRYKELTKGQLPLTECLKDTVERFLPCWDDLIVPAVRSGKKVLVSAHGTAFAPW